VISLSGRMPGRASGPSRSRVDDGGGLQYVSWKIDRALRVLPSRGTYRRKGGIRRWTRGPHHALRLYFGLRLASGKIGTSAFVSSNSKNISCVAFLKHKNSRK
jgi:hypothetical protein